MTFQPHIIIRAPTTLPMQMPIHMGIPIGIQPMMTFQTHHRPHYNNHNNNPGVVQPIPGQPTTTVFIGNISERVPDNLIKQVLIKCGPIISWKRVQDASGKMQAFGFCEYRDPEATLRALRILKDLEIANKALLVKVDQKTKDLLDAHIKKKKSKLKMPENDNALDERTKKEDQHVLKEINAMINANKDLFTKEEDNPDSTANVLADKALKRITGQRVEGETQDSNVNLEAERESLVEREIRSFRDTYKDKQEDRPKRGGRRGSRDDSRERSREPRSRERSRDRSQRPRSPPKRVEERRRERSEDRRRRRKSPSRERSKRRYESGGSDDERKSERRDEPSDEAQIRKKLEKKKRARYDAYRKRLDGWELRERQKRREYEAYEDHEAERKEEQAKERKKIAAFLEDYEDERDDEKYYRGSALSRRIRDREREIESDERDRKKEKEEVEELRRRLQEEYPDKDPDELIAKLNKAEESGSEESPDSSPVHAAKPLVPNLSEISLPAQIIEPPSNDRPSRDRHSHDRYSRDRHSRDRHSRDRSVTPSMPPAPPATIIIKQPAMKAVPNASPAANSNNGPVFGFQMKTGKSSETTTTIQLGGKRKKLEVSNVFNQDEDEENNDNSRKLKLSLPSAEDKRLTDSLIKNNPLSGKSNPLPHSADTPEEKPTISAEDKRKSIKQLIDKIPTQKEELFAYPLDWSVLDKDLMERRVKSWINKKIVEYIGEEEPSLCGFICSKVLAQSQPENILQDVAIVLEEEAEVFVVKMWRLLIYETEAKKLGLVK